MTLPAQIRRVALAGLLVTTAGAAIPGSAQAYVCKGFPTQAVGVRKMKAIARSTATKNWSASVKDQFGLSWSNWKIAKNSSITCNHATQGWICLASADPCNYVVQ